MDTEAPNNKAKAQKYLDEHRAFTSPQDAVKHLTQRANKRELIARTAWVNLYPRMAQLAPHLLRQHFQAIDREWVLNFGEIFDHEIEESWRDPVSYTLERLQEFYLDADKGEARRLRLKSLVEKLKK